MKGPRLNLHVERGLAHPKTTFLHFSKRSTPTYVGYTAAELQFTINPAIDVAADCPAAPRRSFEDDSAAPWQHAPPLDHVPAAGVRAAWHES